MIFPRVRSQSVCIFLCEPEAACPVFSPICTPSSELWISLEQPDRLLIFSFQKLWLPTCSNHLPSKNCSSDLIVRWELGPLTSSVRFLMEFCTRQLHFYRLPLFVFHRLCHVTAFVCHRSLLKSIHRLCHVTAFESHRSLLIEYWVFLWINVLFKFIGFFCE